MCELPEHLGFKACKKKIIIKTELKVEVEVDWR